MQVRTRSSADQRGWRFLIFDVGILPQNSALVGPFPHALQRFLLHFVYHTRSRASLLGIQFLVSSPMLASHLATQEGSRYHRRDAMPGGNANRGGNLLSVQVTCISCWPPIRTVARGNKPSISSMKLGEGLFSLAGAKICVTRFTESPIFPPSTCTAAWFLTSAPEGCTSNFDPARGRQASISLG